MILAVAWHPARDAMLFLYLQLFFPVPQLLLVVGRELGIADKRIVERRLFSVCTQFTNCCETVTLEPDDNFRHVAPPSAE